MNFEFNPFRLLLPPGKEPITSIALQTNLDWFDLPADFILGPAATISIDAKTNIPALKVFGTGIGVGTPSMISLVPAHIPNIEISQVNGLQASLNALVKTITSGNPTALTITNNGVGDYTITPQFGTIANKIAQGNDSRFPSNVTGLRKGAGLASLDVVAVAKTDYWDTSNFIASGASNAKGLVPAPGATAGTTKYLREDGTWASPAGSGTVTSVGLAAPIEFVVGGSPVIGAGTLSFSKVSQLTRTFYAAPPFEVGAGIPTFRTIVYSDISPLVGTAASTVAAGNDTRFPAIITGLRKSSGSGSTDTAAVLGTDYWNGDVFGPTGTFHKKGLVPDPGAGSTTTRFLREDGTWADAISSGLVAQPARTFMANATGATDFPTAVTPKVARSSALLNLEAITTFGDTNYTAIATDKYIATTTSFSADRTVFLPLANSFNPGQNITISDDAGAIGIGSLFVSRQGADFIQGSSTTLFMGAPYGSVLLVSDGVSKWSVARKTPSIIRRTFTSNGTYTTRTGTKALFIELIGGGGGGGGAIASAGNCSSAAGGGSGAYATWWISNPGTGGGSTGFSIGAAGTAGAAGAAGGNGGDTSFGGFVIAHGGAGGGFMASGNTAAFQLGGSPGDCSGGDLQISGSFGGFGTRLSGTAGLSGIGAAASMYSNSVRGRPTEGNAVPVSPGYGGGGAGALSLSASGFTGGIGQQGVMIITEYY